MLPNCFPELLRSVICSFTLIALYGTATASTALSETNGRVLLGDRGDTRSKPVPGDILPADPDFIAVIPSCTTRLPLVRASRSWRRGVIRAFIPLNDSKLARELNEDPESRAHHETYAYYEDDSRHVSSTCMGWS